MTFEERLEAKALKVEENLRALFPSVDYDQRKVRDAMEYSLLAKGKRLRPVLFAEFFRLCGGTDEKAALDFGCALEMIHTYSLIHDDLPCMDDDDFRRGRPSCHKAFDESTALLAGDALLNYAFETMLGADYEAELKLKTAAYIAKKSGVFGMIGGQTIDVCENGCLSDINELRRMVLLKTGALIAAACAGGCILAGADEKTVKAAQSYAEKIGEAFQIRDDILDEIGDPKKLGKKTGSDSKLGKTTFMSEIGLHKCEEEIERLSAEAFCILDNEFLGADFVKELTLWLVGREY